MTHTQNYNLTQWEKTDRILRSDFNADNAAIDTALADHAAQLASLTRSKGNCTIQLTTYTGTGTAPTCISFPRRPTAFIACGFAGILVGWGSSFAYNQIGDGGAISWSGNTARVDLSGTAIQQMNSPGKTYYVVAFYAE